MKQNTSLILCFTLGTPLWRLNLMKRKIGCQSKANSIKNKNKKFFLSGLRVSDLKTNIKDTIPKDLFLLICSVLSVKIQEVRMLATSVSRDFTIKSLWVYPA